MKMGLKFESYGAGIVVWLRYRRVAMILQSEW